MIAGLLALALAAAFAGAEAEGLQLLPNRRHLHCRAGHRKNREQNPVPEQALRDR